ncbi:MAG TPA: ABC transporter permease [Chloroflexota bacterium]
MSVQRVTLETLAAPGPARAIGRYPKPPSAVTAVGTFITRKPLGALGAALILLFLVLAIGAQWLAPYAYDVGTAADRLRSPSLAHPFGTDANGRDLLSRVIWGARVSVTIGFGAVLISTVVAVLVGVTSGYFGGWVDLVVQRVVDIWISFPALVLLVSLVAIVGPGLWSTTVVLGILLAPGTARVVRGAVLSMRNQAYVESAQCIGAGHLRIVRLYVLPNVSAAILVLATTQLGVAILAESTLSFLGYGVPPPFPTWGAMLSGTGRAYMLQSPWLSIWPGLAISAAVFGFNMLGDALRDVLDPRLRGR